MELTPELIEAHKLTSEQVAALSEFGKGVIAKEKGAVEDVWRKKANEDAEGILTGAASKVEEVTKIKRNQGEKIADYLVRTGTEYLGSKQRELDDLKKEYDKKLKEASGADIEAIRGKYEGEKDELLKKFADYDQVKEKATKADEYEKQLTGLQKQIAYGSVKPAFPDTVNKYESDAKWRQFIDKLEAEYTVELDKDNNPVYISKENRHVTGKLSDLVAKDSEIQELLKGRQQGGTGAKQIPGQKLEGVPFDVPTDADTKKIAELVTDHLIKAEKLDKFSPEWGQKFGDLMMKIKKQKTAA